MRLAYGCLVLALLACLARGALVRRGRSTSSCAAPELIALSAGSKLALLRGGKRPGQKTMRLHDLKRNDSANEYYAGGLSEDGGGSATVLLLPDEPGENGTNATTYEAPPPPPKFPEGGGRKL